MLKRIKAALFGALAVTAAMVHSPPALAGTDAYLGEIFVVGSNFCPRSSMEAKGQILKISENSALFSLLGTTYGGDGRTTFALPNMLNEGQDKFANIRFCIVVQGIFPSRN